MESSKAVETVLLRGIRPGENMGGGSQREPVN